MRTLKKLLVLFILALPINTAMILSQETVNSGWVRAISWNDSQNQIALVTQSGSLSIISGLDGQLIHSWDRGDGQSLFSVEWNPSGTLLAVGGAEFLQIRNESEVIYDLPVPRQNVLSLSWHPEGRLLASISQDGYPNNANIWDVVTGQLLYTLPAGEALSAAWSPDGNILAITRIGEIQLWDVDSQQKLDVIPIPGYSLSMAWDINGTQIVSAEIDFPEQFPVRIWDVASHEVLQTFEGHTRSIPSVEWNHITNRIATGSIDGSVRIWDAETGDLLELYQTTDRVYGIDFSPFGGQLAIGMAPSQGMLINAPANTLASNNIQIVVPMPTFEELQAIFQACEIPSLSETINSLTQVTNLITQLESLPTDAIPPACAADLIAVAEAIQNQ